MADYSCHDEYVRDDIAQNDKGADKSYPIRLLIVFTRFFS
jgi:hypothetical protein